MALALRPRFSFDLPAGSRDVLARLGAALDAGPMTLRRTRLPGGGQGGARDHDHLVLTVPTAQQHFWSPWLTLDVRPRDGGTHVHASFSPHPSVWTGFMFGYLTVGLILVFSLLMAGALVATGGEPWSLWVSAGALLGIAGLWGSAWFGQRLAHAQMVALREELDRALAAAEVGAPDHSAAK